jgi:hypothetical protein
MIVDETACNQDDNAQTGGAVRAQDEVKLESVVLPAVDQPSRRRRDASAVEPQANKLKTSAKGRGHMDETALHLVSPQQSGKKHDSILSMQAQRGGTLAPILLPCFRSRLGPLWAQCGVTTWLSVADAGMR